MTQSDDHPNMDSVHASIAKGMKNLLAIAVATNITFKEAESVKALLANSSTFAAVATPEIKCLGHELRALRQNNNRRLLSLPESEPPDLNFLILIKRRLG